MADNHITVYLKEGDDHAGLDDLFAGRTPQVEWTGFINGQDIPVRIRLADEDDDEVESVRGCSCGMADYGAPGHDGGPGYHGRHGGHGSVATEPAP